jgi:hypothetical protein
MISYRESQLLDLINKPTEINSMGTKIWRNKEGQLHRGNDKPAIEYPNGIKQWYINGKFIKRNYDKNKIIYNDKFFDRDGYEIKTTTAQLRDMIKRPELFDIYRDKSGDKLVVVGDKYNKRLYYIGKIEQKINNMNLLKDINDSKNIDNIIRKYNLRFYKQYPHKYNLNDIIENSEIVGINFVYEDGYNDFLQYKLSDGDFINEDHLNEDGQVHNSILYETNL